MKTLRKFVLAILAVCSVSCLLAAPSAAHAGTPVRAQLVSQRACYVYYRANPRSPWTYLGYTYSLSEASAAMNYIRYYGYEAFVR